MRTQMLLEQLRGSSVRMFNNQQQLATGKRLLVSSDDPAGTATVLDANAMLAGQTQLQNNAGLADQFSAITESALSSMRSLLNQAASIASQNVGTTADGQQRASAATIVDGLIAQMVTLGNQEYNGTYIFAGQQCTQPPFEQTAAGVLYKGDGRGLAVSLDGYGSTTISLTGDQVFGSSSAQIHGLPTLAPRVGATTRLSDVAGTAGKGVRLGQIVINEVGGAGSYSVDLSRCSTLGDVVQAINSASTAAGASVNASLTAAGLALTCGAGVTLAVSDPGVGTTASDLGILRPAAAAGPLVGAALQPKLTADTPVGWLRGGLGIDTASGLQLTLGSDTVNVDLSGVATVQDILYRISAADRGVVARINADGTGIDVLSQASGQSLSIGENGGTTATDLGIRSLHAGTTLASLNDGQGVRTVDGTDIRIVLRSGATLDVNVDAATTVGDLIGLINGAGLPVTASLVTNGNGIRLVDASAGAGTLHVEAMNNSLAVGDLGLDGQSAGGVLTGRDVSVRHPDGIFSTLEKLRDALAGNDAPGINAAGARLGQLQQAASGVQGQAAALGQTIQAEQARLGDAVLASKSLLSDAQDADYTDVITRYTQAQTLMQANLMTGSKLLQLSLLDFLQ